MRSSKLKSSSILKSLNNNYRPPSSPSPMLTRSKAKGVPVRATLKPSASGGLKVKRIINKVTKKAAKIPRRNVEPNLLE